MTDLRELRRLEPWFWRAPSAHNTQPWLLEYEPDRIRLGFHPDRHLHAGDPTQRDLYLSLGCFVEAVLVTATAEDIPLEFRADAWAFVPGSDLYRTEFGLEQLLRRQTSRLPYDGGLSDDDLASARAQLRTDERLHELSTTEVLPLFVTADRHLYDSPAVVAELRSWLRLSRRHPHYEHDGLAYDCLALSRLEALAFASLLHPRVYPLVRALRVHRRFTASAQAVLERDGTVLVLEAPSDGPETLIESGRSLLRVWLALTRAGHATHPLSQLLDFESVERELHQKVGAGPDQRLLSVFRAGRSEPAPRSGRLR